MNTRELAQRLADDGCDPSLYAIGSRGAASDAFCLVHDGAQWQVFYTERGQDASPIHRCDNEADACAFFYRHISAMRHHHCVGFFKSQQSAVALQHRLDGVGVSSWTERIPYGGPDDPRWRVFVDGQAILPARAALGPELLRDDVA